MCVGLINSFYSQNTKQVQCLWLENSKCIYRMAHYCR